MDVQLCLEASATRLYETVRSLSKDGITVDLEGAHEHSHRITQPNKDGLVGVIVKTRLDYEWQYVNPAVTSEDAGQS